MMRLQEDQGLEINLTPSSSMFGLGKTLTFIIKVFLGWFKSYLGVVLLCFGFDWQISGEKKKGNRPFLENPTLYYA